MVAVKTNPKIALALSLCTSFWCSRIVIMYYKWKALDSTGDPGTSASEKMYSVRLPILRLGKLSKTNHFFDRAV